MSPNEKIFIQNLINLRKSSKFLQKEMAAKLNIKLSKYKAWETFRNFPCLEDQIKISGYFGYSVEQLSKQLLSTNIAA